MKYILTLAFMLLAFIKSNGQTIKETSIRTYNNQYHNSLDFGIYTYTFLHKDTLIIPSIEGIKFIRIIDRVYKIESPMLTEVKKEKSNWIIKPYTEDSSIYKVASPLRVGGFILHKN